MNKKQMIVIWIIGIIICLALLLTPKKYVLYRARDGASYKLFFDEPKGATDVELRWEKILPILLTSLIVGGLLIYTLRGKKK